MNDGRQLGKSLNGLGNFMLRMLGDGMKFDLSWVVERIPGTESALCVE